MDNIVDLIPQRAPIIMVDEFMGMEGNHSKTRLLVKEENIFVNDGLLTECGLIEHIAQSAAARVGFIFKHKNLPIPIGYIGAVNDFILLSNPKKGDLIVTDIEIITEVLNITLIQAHCYVENELVASSKMKIFLETNEA
ncbi:MAG: hydroxymyristoyl-ACP dehydratase [Bacteroidetes bacterium]|uniref:Hydroxymyristoyl-ACP dehydratase n=1 Tax=Candidatus Gallipaludibacter merdavium TaxID=2840839 RepID=A0A9D9HSC8_9BACT|nr:hydroxymyristoyl-ACP dehydratase [Candidatus Gallipaludibacter merdavium]